MTLSLAMIFLIVPKGHTQSQASAVPSGQGLGPYKMSVDVDLVVLPATVEDRHGLRVSDLDASSFEVYEDRVSQRIRVFRHEDIPVTVGLVVDHSGSMRPKIAEVVAAARTFVRSSNAEDQMFVVNFNETVSLGLPDAIGFTTSSEQLERAIWRSPADGQTALYDAIAKALARLQAGSRDKKVLVVISDGADNASAHSIAQVFDIAERSSAVIYTVGLFASDDPDANPKVLNRLARTTGGEAFFPKRLDDAVTVCERIARDIRDQYTIGYFSTNAKKAGVYRAIRVVAQAPGHGRLFVRTRQGYIAGTQVSRRQDEDEK
jgi:Ca-activated chloride channel homolog